MTYIMIKHLTEEGLNKLLYLYNKVLEEGRTPGGRKEVFIILIRKPEKEPSKPTNYPPIALTSHICKLMKRIVNDKIRAVSINMGIGGCLSEWDCVLCLEDEVRITQGSSCVF